MSPYGKAITDADSGVAGHAAMFSTRPGSRRPESNSPTLRGAATGERVDGQTVLVVNDQADVAELMSLQLRKAGYRILTAADGREGYEVAQAERSDLIISDIVMPRADGIELCRLIRAHPRLRTTPVLLASALRRDSERVVEGLKAGADDYLESPYDRLHLLTRVAQLTERSRAAEALRQSEERYRLLFESNPQPMWVYDLETLRFLAVNEAALRRYGYSREEFLAMTVKDIRPHEDIPALLENVANVRGGLEEAGTWRHLKKDGTVINGYSDLALRRLPAESPLRLHLKEVRKAGERAAGLTRQLLAFSRKQVLQPKVVDLNEVVRETEKMLRRLIGEDIELRAPLEPGLSVLYLDDEPTCLDVFYETFRREYDIRTAASVAEALQMLAERPADIVISDQTMLEVKGTDFLEEVAAVYPSSYRVLLTGSTHLVSVMPEVGSGLIHLFVPKPWTAEVMRRMLERALSTPDVMGEPNAETTRERILIVDDEDAVRRMYAVCLGERYLCTTAADAQEALLRLAAGDYALVITDVQMPGLSGIELLRRVVEHFPETAVIIASGVHRSQRVLDALRLGAYDYLIKPFELDVLELSVERALEKRALLRDARRYKQELESRNAELLRRQQELERLQAQVVHSEKMASLGQLAAGVAHELNNPAGFIYGNMELLAACAAGLERLLMVYDHAELPEGLAAEVAVAKREIDYETTLADIRAIVEDCHDGAERIRDVVQNLRLFSRLDEAEFKKVDLHEGIESTIRLLSQYYGSGRITLERDYADLPPVDCYAGQLNQVWMNLLQNAAQAAGPPGRVRVATRLEGRLA